ncbi:ABC transporter substrate-binding protein [Robertmurraya massiliosenegalensis]|uniref:ABC transporter substrate-binding protein n=1 Tax=Robertmurraya TaxID=2837507 RepID=UPI0039A4C875
MSSKSTLKFMHLLLICVFIISGCSNGATSSEVEGTTSSESPSTTNNDNDSRTLTIAHGSDMQTTDIHNHSHTLTESIHINMVNYLVKNEGDAGFVPDLATEWKTLDDETWEFKLREGVTFHNGEEFTAEDVEYTLERIAKDPSLQNHSQYRQIVDVEVIDDYTVQIHTDGPQPAMLNRLSRSSSGMMPKDYIDEVGLEGYIEHPIGTGPYKFVEWVRDDRVVLEKYEDYWNKEYESDWDQLVFRSIPENSTRVAEVLTGNVDIATNIPPADWDRVNQSDGAAIISGETNRTMMLTLRLTEGYPTSDLRVRQAIDYAIEDKGLIDYVMGGSGTPKLNRENPGTFGFSGDFHDKYNYDPEKAKELLAEAGYADGVKIKFHATNGRYLQDREMAEVIVGMLAEVGITAELEFMEWSAFTEMREADKNEEMYLIGLASSLFDSAQGLDAYGSWQTEGHTDYYNEEVDELLTAAEINMDPESRAEQYYRVQEIAAEELPYIYLFQVDNFYAVSDRISFIPRLNEMWMVEEIKMK